MADPVTMTVGQLLEALDGQPADRPVIIGTQDWYLNLRAVNDSDEQHAIVIESADDYDTRQW